MSRILDLLRPTNRYQNLFRRSDSQLAARGYARGGLTQAYIKGISAR